MKKKHQNLPLIFKSLIIFSLLVTTIIGKSQNGFVKGKLVDSIGNKQISNSVVMLLNAKDSNLVAFTRTDSLGKFELSKLPIGKYVLFFTYPGKPTVAQIIAIKDGEQLDLATIGFKNDPNDIVVKSTLSGIKLKGDTTEYTADSFKVAKNANVADLLKKLPGIEVDAKGVIKAQGEKVEKILIDGDEFFGDDPTMVSKSLNASIVDKVQVFDKKSEESEFSGVDDGQRTKTINLSLKANARKGYFGKMSAAVGPPDLYANSAMINKFRGKTKLSIYGTMANNGSEGLDWQDKEKYAGESWLDNMEMSENGYFTNEDYEWDGGSGDGFPQAWNAGGHFSDKRDNDRKRINASFQFGKNNLIAASSSLGSTLSKDSVINTASSNVKRSTKLSNKLAGFYETNLDSLSTLKWNIGGSSINNKFNRNNTSFSNIDGVRKANDNINSLRGNATDNDFNTKVTYKKKYKKAGRTLTISSRFGNTEKKGENFLLNIFTLYKNGILLFNEVTDQKKENKNIIKRTEAKASFTEGLSKKWTANFSYALQNTNSFNEVRSIDKDGTGNYILLNTKFSNGFKVNILNNNFTTGLVYNHKKLNAGFGTGINFSHFEQENTFSGIITNRNFVNLFPKANFIYKIKKQTSLRFSYNGSTRQPSINQLQPLLQNEDRLSTVIGNPNLKQSFSHSFNMGFNDNKTLKGKNIWSNAYFTINQNQISNATVLDTGGTSTTQYINVKGNYYGGMYFNFSKAIKSIKKGDLNANIRFNYNINRNLNYFNNEANITSTHTPNLGFGFYYSLDEKFDMDFGTSVSYNYTKTSIKTQLSNNFFNYNIEGGGNLNITKQLKVGTTVNMDFRQKTERFTKAINIINWNASLKYQMLKSKNLEAGFTIQDILNQRQVYNRFVSSNFISENRAQTLQRVAMLSLTWNFKKN